MPAAWTRGDTTREAVAGALAHAGWEPPLWLESSAEDPGYGATRQALSQGAGLVIACGGDGTVRAVLTELAGSGVPLAVLPAGTGNLLARNLNVPLNDPVAAIGIALTGADRAIDVGTLEPATGAGRPERFAVMAGVGLDAAIMRDAPESVKARVGWPAYLLSAARQLRGPGVQVRVVIDGGRPLHTRAQTVVVGNLGMLQGGIQLLTDAVPDDGLLDVAVISSRGLLDMARIAGRLVTRRPNVDHRFRTFQGRRIEVRLRRPAPRQVDGDLVEPSTQLVARIEPRAVVIRVPRPGR